MPALAVMLGSFASRNPLASLGGSREVKLMIAYELPLGLGILGVVLATGSLRMQDVIQDLSMLSQLEDGSETVRHEPVPVLELVLNHADHVKSWLAVCSMFERRRLLPSKAVC